MSERNVTAVVGSVAPVLPVAKGVADVLTGRRDSTEVVVNTVVSTGAPMVLGAALGPVGVVIGTVFAWLW